MNLRLRNVFFSPDGRGNGKIQDVEKGTENAVGRDELKKIIQNGEPVVVIHVESNVRNNENRNNENEK